MKLLCHLKLSVSISILWLAIFNNELCMSHAAKVSMSAFPQGNILLGNSINISCMFDNSSDLAVIWKHKGKGIFEQFHKYPSPSKVTEDVVCINILNTNITKIIIRKATWRTRGNWQCVQGRQIASVDLIVEVPPVLSPLLFSYGPLTEKLRPSASTMRGGRQVEIVRSIHKGRPYLQLRGDSSTSTDQGPVNITVSVICKTQCVFPVPEINWVYTNSQTNHEHSLQSAAIQHRKECSNEAGKAGLFRVSSTLTVNCARYGLQGKLEVTCIARTKSDRFVQDNFFVLCPGGDKEIDLTTGEFVAILVGCMMGTLVTAFIIYLLCQRSHVQYEKPMQQATLL